MRKLPTRMLDATGLTDGYLKVAAGELATAAGPALADLTDVMVASPATGNVIRWSGAEWVNAYLSTSDVTSGVFDPARLGTGTADATTILHGDGAWKPAATGGGSAGGSGLFRGVWAGGAVRLVDQPMTSNTAPAPYQANASATSAGAYRLFNQAGGTGWQWNHGADPAVTSWVSIALGSAKTLTRYALRADPTNAAAQMPAAWKVQGSSDGVTWVDVDTRSGQTWANSETKSFTVATPARYSRFRLFITLHGSGTGWTSIDEWELWEDLDPYMTGEYVVRNGRLWRSDADNNTGTPGTSGWTEIPLGYDRAVSTATRPTGVTAGAHVFDTTLGKPVWFNGTGWVDATGATV